MKKYIPLVVLFALVLTVTQAFAAGLSQATPIVLDPALISVITAAVSFAVSYLVTAVADLTKIDLSPAVAGIVQVVVQVILLFVTGLLAQLPANLVPLILSVVMAVLGYFGMFATQTRHVAMNKSLKLFKYSPK